MKILVLNSGSSSVKFQLWETSNETVLCKGLIEKIGEPLGVFHIQTSNCKKIEKEQTLPNHTVALQELIRMLPGPELGCLNSLQEISAVGHRVVHGGEVYSESILIDQKSIDTIDQLSELAPLHNPPNLKGIQACCEILPGVPQVGVFDTAFHQTMPAKSFMYPLPKELYDKFRIRRYGFHGTSHRYVHGRACILAGLEDKPSRIITAHLGNGCSIAAIKDGKVIDTSMGFTPLEGLVMGTRPGDIDASLPFFLLERQISAKEIMNMFQKKSGLLGLSGGVSNDMRELLSQYDKNPQAQLAVDVFCYRLKKYIGSYTAALGGLDVLIFTGGIGENAAPVRAMTCEGLECLGVELDVERNKVSRGKEELISKPTGRAKVYVIPTNEELVIAQETRRLVEKQKA